MDINRGKKCALILAGCGAKDGSEITEVVSLMIAFAQAKIEVSIFAPDRNCHHVVDHLTDTVSQNESRNMLCEAARIARGRISSLDDLQYENFDILCFSGGFGVAKNLCDFAFSGKNAILSQDIENVLFAFIKANKIVSALCIAPILLALAAKKLQLKNVSLTFGSKDSDPVKTMESWGLHHKEKEVFEACIDTKNKFVTAPAYMYDQATPLDIFSSANALVKGVEFLLNSNKA